MRLAIVLFDYLGGLQGTTRKQTADGIGQERQTLLGGHCCCQAALLHPPSLFAYTIDPPTNKL